MRGARMKASRFYFFLIVLGVGSVAWSAEEPPRVICQDHWDDESQNQKDGSHATRTLEFVLHDCSMEGGLKTPCYIARAKKDEEQWNLGEGILRPGGNPSDYCLDPERPESRDTKIVLYSGAPEEGRILLLCKNKHPQWVELQRPLKKVKRCAVRLDFK